MATYYEASRTESDYSKAFKTLEEAISWTQEKGSDSGDVYEMPEGTRVYWFSGGEGPKTNRPL